MQQTMAELRVYGPESKRHRHEFHQMVLPNRGVLELEVEHRSGIVAPGQAAFIPAGESHAFSAQNDNSFIVTDLPVSGCSVPDAAWDRFSRSPFFTIGPATQLLIDFLGLQLQQSAISPEVVANWSHLFLQSIDQAITPIDSRQHRLDRAMAFMRARLAHPIGMEDVAAACGLSTNALYRLFKAKTGRSPQAALNRLRLDQACHLLVHTDIPIVEIALRTGHADQSALTRKLRQQDGITPAALRRLGQSERRTRNAR
ncbi:AraC family transcriptional regulator [Rhodoligotrophos ferricapiens]|uniref:AraC family transcriptional regulator n=1 Tax=Rhodoligotrophos ferricapiens TaxID=3069264 RepID=UPI00315D2C3F